MSKGHVLVADDESDVVVALRLLLGGEGYAVKTAVSSAEALEALGTSAFDVVLMDMNYTRGTTCGEE